MAPRRFYSNANAFKNPETNEQAAYWIGFLMADGCIKKDGKTLALVIKDKEHLEKYRTFLGAEREVKGYISSFNTPYYNLTVTNEDIVVDLNKYGITNKKSLIADVPSTLSLNRHFWRGMIDGDGSIVVKKPTISICGTSKICEGFKQFVSKIVPCEGSVRPIKGANCNLFATNSSYACKVINVLYENSNVYLDRKYNLYLSLANQSAE